MSNEEKAIIYDQLIRESDRLQRENSKLKSENAGNIPDSVQRVINDNDRRIGVLVERLKSLFS